MFGAIAFVLHKGLHVGGQYARVVGVLPEQVTHKPADAIVVGLFLGQPDVEAKRRQVVKQVLFVRPVDPVATHATEELVARLLGEAVPVREQRRSMRLHEDQMRRAVAVGWLVALVRRLVEPARLNTKSIRGIPLRGQ